MTVPDLRYRSRHEPLPGYDSTSRGQSERILAWPNSRHTREFLPMHGSLNHVRIIGQRQRQVDLQCRALLALACGYDAMKRTGVEAAPEIRTNGNREQSPRCRPGLWDQRKPVNRNRNGIYKPDYLGQMPCTLSNEGEARNSWSLRPQTRQPRFAFRRLLKGCRCGQRHSWHAGSAPVGRLKRSVGASARNSRTARSTFATD